MTRLLNVPIAVALVATLACGGEGTPEDDAARDLSMAPAESIAAMNDAPQSGERAAVTTTPPRRDPPPRPQPPAPLALPPGTIVELAATDTISSRTNEAGDIVTATVRSAIADSRGRVVIPAGAVFTGVIAEIAPAGSPGGEGTLRLAFSEVSFGGRSYRAVAAADTLGTETQGRGVTAGDAAKVGVGAAAGAIAGRIIGKDTKGAIIGGVVGAAAGAGVAAATKDEDIVLPAGGRIRLVLQEEMVLTPIG